MAGLTSDSQFARNIFWLFVIGFALVLGLELLEEATLIGKLTESAVCAVIWGSVGCWLVFKTHATFHSRSLLIAVSVFAFFSTAGFVLGVFEDIRWFDAVPFPGRSGAYHGVPQKLCFCIWSCSIAWMFLLLLKGVEQTQAESDKLRSELAHVTRVTALGEMAGSIAHELKQPLSAISNFAAAANILIVRDPDARDQVCRLLEEISTQAQRSGHIISRLRAMTEPSPESHQEISVNDLVTDILDLMRPSLRNNDVTIQTELPESNPLIVADSIQIQQVLMNLLRNAIDSVSNQPVETRGVQVCVRAADIKTVEITVTDSGPGVADEMVKNLFEAFFTTKPGGMGIGLSISRSIMNAHAGTISYDAGYKSGARFRLTLPKVKRTVPDPHFRKQNGTDSVPPDRGPSASLDC